MWPDFFQTNIHMWSRLSMVIDETLFKDSLIPLGWRSVVLQLIEALPENSFTKEEFKEVFDVVPLCEVAGDRTYKSMIT